MAQSPDEKTYVEIPFIEQLKWKGSNLCLTLAALKRGEVVSECNL